MIGRPTQKRAGNSTAIVVWPLTRLLEKIEQASKALALGNEL